MDSVELLDTQQYDKIKGVIDTAMRAGVERDIGHEYITGLEERLSKQTRVTQPTKWDSVNELMDGGLAGGELGVIVAPAGIGSLASRPKAAEILIVPPTVTVNVSATASGTVLLTVIATSSVSSHPPPSVTLYVKNTINGFVPVTY